MCRPFTRVRFFMGMILVRCRWTPAPRAPSGRHPRTGDGRRVRRRCRRRLGGLLESGRARAGARISASSSTVTPRDSARTPSRGGQQDRAGCSRSARPRWGSPTTRLQARPFAPPYRHRPKTSRLESLVTHHVGATLVHSIVDGHRRRGDGEDGSRACRRRRRARQRSRGAARRSSISSATRAPASISTRA